jgi:hypothetical protein
MILGILLLLAGLTISAVAIYYSVLGLAAIFAAATIPIYIMGGALEVSKLIAASWLKANWHRATGLIKYYMLVAVTILMIITSMGIFGFLSKAHLDQSVPAGDVAAQVALLDEKIKIQKDNIDSARRALEQMDSQVNQRLAGNNAQQSAERSVQIRRAQAKERAALQSEITTAQQTISKLNEERAPIASQLRKVEAEVGPIKYIAQFVYGQEADQGLLEKSVTWVIILIVLVFDPLAIVMLLAAQMTFNWYKKDKEQKNDIINTIDDTEHSDNKNADSGLLLVPEPSAEPVDEPVVESKVTDIQPVSILSKHPYLEKPFSHFKNLTPLVSKTNKKEEIPTPEIEVPVTEDVDSTEGKKYKLLPELQEETQKKKFIIKTQGQQLTRTTK